MGVYDEIIVDDNNFGQVKCWECLLKIYRKGDKVPKVYVSEQWIDNYSIAMREGGYVNIKEGVLVSWTNEPELEIVIDKWGHLFSKEFTTDPMSSNMPYVINVNRAGDNK